MARGRKPGSATLTTQVHLKATPAQKGLWTVAAGEAGMTLSDWLRQLADAAAGPAEGGDGDEFS